MPNPIVLADTFEDIGAVATVTEMQAAIHRGNAYGVSGILTIAAGADVKFLLRTGAEKVHFMDAHFDFSQGDLTLALYENPTVTSVGAVSLTPVNLNRELPIPPSTALVYSAPTIGSNGTELSMTGVMPTSKAPVSDTIASGRVLAHNEDYLMVIHNNAGSGTTTFSYTLLWHESLV